MGCDMVVALARATADGHTLFGHNSNRPASEGQALVRQPGREFAPGERLHASGVELPQVRQTHTVLACRSPGLWGYWAGVNDQQVAVGVTTLRTRLSGESPGLAGTDLVRLALERASSARQAVDVLTDLVSRHGQEMPGGGAATHDSSFLIADGREAFALETYGSHWALQVVGAVRAAADVGHLRQDWDRISRGLADLAIDRGWWPENGSKLDVADALGLPGAEAGASLRRWGRATLLLEQEHGQVHTASLRSLLSDPVEGLPALPGPRLAGPGERDEPGSGASLVAVLSPDPAHRPVAWWSFGAPCTGLYFPLFLEGELPAAFTGEAGCLIWRQMAELSASRGLRGALAGLQEQFDQHAREFLAEAVVLKRRGAGDELRRLAGSFMQHTLESWEALGEEAGLTRSGASPRHDAGEPPYVGAHAPAAQPLTLSDEGWLEP